MTTITVHHLPQTGNQDSCKNITETYMHGLQNVCYFFPFFLPFSARVMCFISFCIRADASVSEHSHLRQKRQRL